MKLLNYFGITTLAIIMVACGGKKVQENEGNPDEILNESQAVEVVTVVQSEPEPTNPLKDDYGNMIYQPPFSFTAKYTWTKRVKDWDKDLYVEKPEDILTYEITIKPGGMFTGRQKEIILGYGDNYLIYNKVDTLRKIDVEISGKWNDSYMTMGEGYMKGYNLESPDFEKDWSLYLMGNGEYAWYCRYPRLNAEEWKTENRMSVSNIKVL